GKMHADEVECAGRGESLKLEAVEGGASGRCPIARIESGKTRDREGVAVFKSDCDAALRPGTIEGQDLSEMGDLDLGESDRDVVVQRRVVGDDRFVGETAVYVGKARFGIERRRGEIGVVVP